MSIITHAPAFLLAPICLLVKEAVTRHTSSEGKPSVALNPLIPVVKAVCNHAPARLTMKDCDISVAAQPFGVRGRMALSHGCAIMLVACLAATASATQCVTNVAQFQNLPNQEYLNGCDFDLTGILTLVDTNRELLVVQDATGAVALHFPIESKLHAGQSVTLHGTNCSPLVLSFPNFPDRPSGVDILDSFETPSDWGVYNLTRLRGFLRPQVTGEYKFGIASDNSSELWLSTDAEPANARRIASIGRFEYVSPRDWSHFPSQQSEPIQLKAGETYYIEALQEQSGGGENLSVAWQGPLPDQKTLSVIDGHFLRPWHEGVASTNLPRNGILRETWTNYFAGNLADFERARPFASALSVKSVWSEIHGAGERPAPVQIDMSQPLPVENNYRWMQAEGVVRFVSASGPTASIELSDGQALLQVRLDKCSLPFLERLTNVAIKVEGVCEGILDQKGTLFPGLIWASGEENMTLIGAVTNNFILSTNQPAGPDTYYKPVTKGFYSTRGVVMFCDRVFDDDYILIEEDQAVIRVQLDNESFKSQLPVGMLVDLGGELDPGKFVSIIKPLVITEIGRSSMPAPIVNPVNFSNPENLEGKWTELEGIVRSVNSNGTLTIVGRYGTVCLWIGRAPAESLAQFVDAKLRVRGALMLTMLNVPLLLVPSRDFIDVEEKAPANPFSLGRNPISKLFAKDMDPLPHRVHVAGEITYQNDQSLFIEDSTGGIRVQAPGKTTAKIGDAVEVAGFPVESGSTRILTEALVHPATMAENISPQNLDLSEAFSTQQGDMLVCANATLLAHQTNGANQVLELQEQQRIFTATLNANQGRLPALLPGSRLHITGVRDDETAGAHFTGEKFSEATLPSSLNLLLRTPQDVLVISGPPWWTWKRTAGLVVLLLTILAVALLWVYLLRRRLERQQAAQLAFSRHVFGKLEEERRRIAINLHDSLGQMLLVIKNHALLARQPSAAEQGTQNRLDEISGTTTQAIEEVRRITRGLRPYQLDRLGLTQAIRATVENASENCAILFASRIEDIANVFDKDSEIHVFRIVQEAVNNVVKHSGATEATVVIKKRETSVALSIRDNGKGFDPAKNSGEAHDLGLGLSGITERVRILDGSFTLNSRPGEGVNLMIEIPFRIPKR